MDNWENNSRMLTQFIANSDNTARINDMLNNNQSRLDINLDELRTLDNNLCQEVIKDPHRAIGVLEKSLQSQIDDNVGGKKKDKMKYVTEPQTKYRVNFTGNLGRNYVTPTGLNASKVNNYVAVQGIVSRMSIVRSKMIRSVHYCDKTSTGLIREYNDLYELGVENSINSATVMPLKDANGNALSVEYGYCKFKDYQTLVLQEMPEKAPVGMLPGIVEVVLEEDLVDKVKPGDRVEVRGVYKCIVEGATYSSGIFKSVLVATNVSTLASGIGATELTASDISNIRKISEKKDCFELLSRSFAPSIFGHDYIKKALILMLLGGVEKNLENQTHLRGDINILVIGDPSTAKSQLLRKMIHVAPISVSTTGRGSSGVGLTAAVSFDKDTGERHLEAGAMVLADKGVVCIDEFDKMSEADRVAIHEVMEQQTVTIAKAGIHASLNARCSVLAAANPIYGSYQRDLPPTKNIGMPDSLLSRFDLLFVVLDQKNSDNDREVADRVIRNHRYIGNKHADQMVEDHVVEPDYIEKNCEVYEKYNAVIHSSDQKHTLLSLGFLKKYMQFAKKTAPQLTEEAIEFISKAWAELRDEQKIKKDQNLPITIRTVETLIRLSTAHAKLRLKKTVTIEDSRIALKLLKFALYSEQEETEDMMPEVKELDENNNTESMNERVTRSKAKHLEEEMMEEKPLERPVKKTVRSSKGKRVKIDEEEEDMKAAQEKLLENIPFTDDNKKFTFYVLTKFAAKEDQCTFDQLWEAMKQSTLRKPGKVTSEDQLKKALLVLERENKIALSSKDGVEIVNVL